MDNAPGPTGLPGSARGDRWPSGEPRSRRSASRRPYPFARSGCARTSAAAATERGGGGRHRLLGHLGRHLDRRSSPGQLFLRAAGSLGWAFPAALGAKCAVAERPVVCFTGDGAFWYHLAELETAVRWNIPTVTVINNNSVLGQSQLGIRRAYRGEPGNQEEQYRFNDTDFARLAEDLGALGIRVEQPEDIRPGAAAGPGIGPPGGGGRGDRGREFPRPVLTAGRTLPLLDALIPLLSHLFDGNANLDVSGALLLKQHGDTDVLLTPPPIPGS